MGTYDTRGGGAISPCVDNYYISSLEEAVLELLEKAGLPEKFNDSIVKQIAEMEMQS